MTGVDFVANSPIASVNAPVARNGSAQAAPTAVNRRNAAVGLSELRY